MRFSDLTQGYEFPAADIALDPGTVARYLAATDDDNALYWRDGEPYLVPPLAVAALAFRGIAHDLALEPGSLHTGQNLTFRRLITVGEHLVTLAHVSGSSRRRDFTALTIDIAAADDAGETPLSGRMTLMASATAEAAGGGDRIRAAHVSTPGRTSSSDEPQVIRNYQVVSGEELAPGFVLGSITRTVTQDRINRYAVASGDYNPIHLDHDFAARSAFGGTIAHGMLLLSYFSILLAREFGVTWLDTGAMNVKFRKPAPAGATVTATGRVERLDEDHGVQYAMCALRLEDSAGDTLITGDARVDVL